MPVELWCAIISAVVSLLVSLITNKWDVIKLKLGWARQDRVTANDTFADMAAAVSAFIVRDSTSYRERASSLVAAARAQETGSLADQLDILYYTMRDYPRNAEAIDTALTAAINEKRDQRSRAEAKTKKLTGS